MKRPHYLLVGVDNKVDWDNGHIRFFPPGNDRLCIFDVGADPLDPKLVAQLTLPNSVFGPPTNLAVTPDQTLALVADPMAWTAFGQQWKPVPGDGLFVVDLSAQPVAVRERIQVGHQPSGLAINPQGTLVLVTNRADMSVTVLSINERQVRVEDSVYIGTEVCAVSFAADGNRAFVVKPQANRMGVLHIDGMKVTHDPTEDLPTGPVPYNLVVSHINGLALTVDMGCLQASDGHVDGLSVIDLECRPPRVIDRIKVGDGPEGIAVAPDGRHAAVASVQGSNNPSDAWFHNRFGEVSLLSIVNRQASVTATLPVGALPEGLAFSPDSRYLYVGNFLDSNLWVLEVNDGTLLDTGKRIPLPGHPASMRTQSC